MGMFNKDVFYQANQLNRLNQLRKAIVHVCFLCVLCTSGWAAEATSSSSKRNPDLKQDAVELRTSVNVNTADAATIASALTGVGSKRAQAIVRYREQNGPFKTAQELTAVKGIGSSVIEKNRDKLAF